MPVSTIALATASLSVQTRRYSEDSDADGLSGGSRGRQLPRRRRQPMDRRRRPQRGWAGPGGLGMMAGTSPRIADPTTPTSDGLPLLSTDALSECLSY